MSLKKLVLTCFCCSAFFAIQPIFASSCSSDVKQMNAQISQYDSISNNTCPRNEKNWGINKVNTPKQSGTQCNATCYYAGGAGSFGVQCSWTLGNWGDTLRCAL